ncbi:hypothetical protein BCR42DRAFT_388846 [Absidia repens]|uniref:Cas12f1-like TNB domain-containing protein n=1 Tax=Absidia repens TaxID=90262 RepID=A0A1X2IV62_9FUNG|nr:hypothetical protein BCR42DRAFT_388846 [Absidia repens]
MLKTEAIRTVEAQITTNKTTDLEGIQAYIQSSLQALSPLTEFYGQEAILGLQFANYQGRQKMDAELVNVLIDGGHKYRPPPGAMERSSNIGQTQQRRRRRTRKWKKAPINNDKDKVPIVVFGDAKFGRNKKGEGSLADKCRHLLSKADKSGKLVFVNMDEYRTSQVCSKCGHRKLTNAVITRPGEQAKRMYAVLACRRCNTVWQRDTNASRNLRAAFMNLVTAGRRPGLLARPTTEHNPHNKYVLMYTQPIELPSNGK